MATRVGSLALTVLALGLGWLFLAPPELGGSTRYAIVDGSSMEPGLRAGYLALVRTDREVDVGDAVLYHDDLLGVDVLHRIVRRDGETFVLKGDANGFLDATRPTRGEIDGELWLSVPYAGSAIVWARQPLHAAIGVFVLTFLLLAGGARREELREQQLEA